MSILRVDNPFTLNSACEVPLAEWDDIERVLELAQAGARAAAQVPLVERKALVERALKAMEAKSEQIAEDISRMMGKPLSQARGELRTMATRARAMIQLADQGLLPLVVEAGDGIARRVLKVPL